MDTTTLQAVTVRLFGAFRQYADPPRLQVSLPAGATVAQLRSAFAEALPDDNARVLLKASAFATDEAVLEEDDPVPVEDVLSVLPPVCGG